MIAATTARVAADLLFRTWRMDFEGEEHHHQIRVGGRPVIFAVWHGQLLPALCRHRGEGITLLVSAHRDGGYLAGAAARWGFRTVRGSSTRGSLGGLRGLLRTLQAGNDVALTPDGPRGPARVPKEGVVALAQLTGTPIIPVGTAAASAWRWRSWDRFELPKPLSRVSVVYGRPVRVVPGRRARAAAVRELAVALNRAESDARCRL